MIGSGARSSVLSMRADQLQARAVAKIVLVALFWIAVAVLLAILTAATLEVVIDELVLSGAAGSAGPQPEAAD